MYGGMAMAYEKREGDLKIDRFSDCIELEREFTNSFWLIRSLLPYGADCEVISPQGVRTAIAETFTKASQRYS